jgi:hypothetical protein
VEGELFNNRHEILKLISSLNKRAAQGKENKAK